MRKTIYLSGGLGNQLFQIVAALHLSRSGADIFIDTSLTEKGFIPEKLMNWNVHGDFVSEMFSNLFQFGRRHKALVLFDLTLLLMSRYLGVRVARRKYLHTPEIKIDTDLGVYMGYFQNLDIYPRDALMDYISILEEVIKKPVISDRVIIHFRGSDSSWARQHFYYYSRVFEIVEQNLQPVIIVTDDSKACELFAKGYNLEYQIINGDVLEDFKLLCSASQIFTAPSTFSWWAGVLHRNKKTIYMPKFFEQRFKLDGNITYL